MGVVPGWWRVIVGFSTAIASIVFWSLFWPVALLWSMVESIIKNYRVRRGLTLPYEVRRLGNRKAETYANAITVSSFSSDLSALDFLVIRELMNTFFAADGTLVMVTHQEYSREGPSEESRPWNPSASIEQGVLYALNSETRVYGSRVIDIPFLKRFTSFWAYHGCTEDWVAVFSCSHTALPKILSKLAQASLYEVGCKDVAIQEGDAGVRYVLRTEGDGNTAEIEGCRGSSVEETARLAKQAIERACSIV